ncbi:DUF1707 domain-containing protein [Streptomyces sp. TRM70308]|uniref:DUF1707 SHOCT-like domain-containing protein n=1 Tax=Streptomyces sp. TRM70308 TaxID=3131932 RepID=UPI003D02C5D9
MDEAKRREGSAGGGPDGVAVRASDADRERIATLLGEGLAEGRLTAEEHAERVAAAYRARTREQLAPLVADLPGGHAPAHAGARPTPPARAGSTLVGLFAGAVRRGRWRVGPRLNAFACFGPVEIDLTEALFEQQEVVVTAVALLGSVEVRVPENVTLRDAGSSVMGAFEVEQRTADDRRAPVVVVRGVSVCGSVQAAAKRGKKIRDLRSRRD